MNREGLQAAAAKFCRVMCLASPLGMVRLIWRPHLKRIFLARTHDSFREVYRTVRKAAFLIVNERDGEDPQANKWLSI